MTQGKIERWHLTLKNRILLENYYLPGELELRIEAFVAQWRSKNEAKRRSSTCKSRSRTTTISLPRARVSRQRWSTRATVRVLENLAAVC
jgi:hypothetical protein